jgi:flagellin
MSVVINTNTAASQASYNLSSTNVNLQRSLNRLSSGSRINSSFDDAGGLAVSMKMSASIRRTEATIANVNNSISFLQTQDGVLKTADKVLSRMSELTQLSTDVTKSTSDLALYQTEFNTLKAQLNRMMREDFNGISLFTIGTTGETPLTSSTLNVVTTHDGTQSVGITQADLGSISTLVGTTGNVATVATTEGVNISTVSNAQASVSIVTQAIQNLAQLRAFNGSEQSRLTFASEMLAVNKVNLESANSRIIDVDVAKESSTLARWNILQQAGTAMLAQANQSTQSILRLLS